MVKSRPTRQTADMIDASLLHSNTQGVLGIHSSFFQGGTQFEVIGMAIPSLHGIFKTLKALPIVGNEIVVDDMNLSS